VHPKWYSNFIPQLVRSCQIDFRPNPDLLYKIVFDDESEYELGFHRETGRDRREESGPTSYVSAGSSASYVDQFKWKVNEEGRIYLDYDDSQKALAAHRTFVSDTRGKHGTCAIVTSFMAHRGKWRLSRVGQLDQMRYIIYLESNVCVKDKIDQRGWALSMAPTLYMEDSRGANSRYVHV